MAQITGAPTNDLAAFDTEVWSDLLIERVRTVNVAMGAVANTDYEGDIRKAGDTVRVRTLGGITLGDYSKFDAVTYQSLAPASEPLVVNEAKYFAFALDDIEPGAGDGTVESGYVAEAAIAIDSLVDAKILGMHASAKAANKIGSPSAPVVLDGSTNTLWGQLVAAEKALNDQGCPQAGRWFVMGPQAKSWLSRDAALLKAATPVADQLIRSARVDAATPSAAPGYVGTVLGFDLYLSNNLATGSATVDSAAVTYEACLYGQGRPIAYAGKIRKVEVLRLESTFATAVRGVVLHGTKVFAEASKRLGAAYLA